MLSFPPYSTKPRTVYKRDCYSADPLDALLEPKMQIVLLSVARQPLETL